MRRSISDSGFGENIDSVQKTTMIDEYQMTDLPYKLVKMDSDY